MWHVTRFKWHVTPDMWHEIHYTYGMVSIMWKLQVPSSYGSGMVENWHVTQDTRHMTCDKRHVTNDRWFLSASYIPLDNKKTICLVSNFYIISKSTLFLLKTDLHCNLPNFINVSNTSAQRPNVYCQDFCSLAIVGNVLEIYLKSSVR